MRKIILTKGLPASGKSTWAKEMVDKYPGQYKRVNKDDLRAMLDSSRWSKENEKFVLALRDHVITSALQSGVSVIVDDTNLHHKHLDRMNEIAKEFKANGVEVQVEVKEFTDIPLEVCIERDLKRPNSVGERVIERMYNEYLKPKPLVVERNPELPDCIVVDLDGTLALFGDANPYDRDFLQDRLNLAVAQVLSWKKNAERDGYPFIELILLSGRQEKFRKQTEEWLWNNRVLYETLHMRKTDDVRKDFIIKKELYEEHIKGKYNVLFILDDRNQVVNMWRAEGLTVFQVAEGDF